MKEITIYECEDGSRFDIKEKAERYEGVLERVKQIMAPIGDAVTEMYQAKQRSRTAVDKAVIDLMHLCAWCIPEWEETFQRVKNIDDAQRTIVGRVLCDYSYEWKCLYNAFFRFLCISRVTYMEYEQPYWTTHEHEYKDELIKRKIEEN